MKSSQIELVIFFLIVLCNFFLCLHYRYCMLSIYLFISFTRLVFWRQGPCHCPIAFSSPWFSDWHKDIQYILTEQMNECWETIPICFSSWWQLNEFPQNSVTQQLNTKNVYQCHIFCLSKIWVWLTESCGWSQGVVRAVILSEGLNKEGFTAKLTLVFDRIHILMGCLA